MLIGYEVMPSIEHRYKVKEELESNNIFIKKLDEKHSEQERQIILKMKKKFK